MQHTIGQLNSLSSDVCALIVNGKLENRKKNLFFLVLRFFAFQKTSQFVGELENRKTVRTLDGIHPGLVK